MIRLLHARETKVYAQAQCGRYTVQVIKGWSGEYCYRVLQDGYKISMMRRSDERTFPKRASRLGSEMVQAMQDGRAETEQTELFIA